MFDGVYPSFLVDVNEAFNNNVFEGHHLYGDTFSASIPDASSVFYFCRIAGIDPFAQRSSSHRTSVAAILDSSFISHAIVTAKRHDDVHGILK